MTTQTPAPEKTSGFEPLREPLFRDRWIASIVSNVGSWMQDTAGTWLMAVLTTSPLLISLMQTAASLPVLLLGLLAGATADIYDRRRLLIFWQAWMLGTVAVLSLLTFLGIISPWVLLLLTFGLNIGAAMNNPAWQAIVPELVPASQLPDAVALNSAGFNLARAVGPALGGFAVAAFGAHVLTGTASVFLLNAISFVGVIWVLYRWKRTPLFKSALPAERVHASIRSGIRYLRHSPALQSTFLRSLLFTVFVSAVWSLLAVVSRHELHQGATGYGLLNGSMGLGAVIGAFALPRVRRLVSADWIITLSTATFVAITLRPCVCTRDSGDHPLSDCRRICVDQHYVEFERVGASVGSVVGASASAWNVSDGCARGHGGGRSAMGLSGRTDIHPGIPDGCGCRAAADAADCVALSRFARRDAGSQPVST